MGSQTGPIKTFAEMTPEERSEHLSLIFCTPDPPGYVSPHMRQPADDTQEGTPQPPPGNGADDGAGQGMANGADLPGAFDTTEQDAPLRPYDRLLPHVEALKPEDPAALDWLLRAIFAAELSTAERETLFDMVRKKVGFIGRAFDRVLRDYRAAPKQDIVDDEQIEPAIAPLTPYDLGLEVCRLFHKQVRMTQHDEVVATTWSTGTWGFEHSPIYPRLGVRSPTPDCGKSTLLDSIETAVWRPVRVDSITPAALLRALDELKPTFLLDEGDTYLRDSPDFQKVLNSGHRRRGSAILNAPGAKPGEWKLRRLRTYAPVVYASLADIHPSTMSRSLMIVLQRATGVLDQLDEEGLAAKHKELAPHFLAHKDAIGAALAGKIDAVLLPQGLRTRQLDNWRPMFLIARWFDQTRPVGAAFSWFDAVYAACSTAMKVPRAQTDREKLLVDLYGVMLEERRQAADRLREWQKVTGRGATAQSIASWYARAALDPKVQARAARLTALKPPRSLQRHRPAAMAAVPRPVFSTATVAGQEWAECQLFDSKWLTAKLNVLEHRPWPGYNDRARETGICAANISKMMKHFDIVPGRHLSGGVVASRGYDNKSPPYGYSFNDVRQKFRKFTSGA